MRLYIYKITKHDDQTKPDSYDFTKTISGAWHWETKQAAERAQRIFVHSGITVEAPWGQEAPCIDFQVEPRPDGGFAISCEHPFASD